MAANQNTGEDLPARTAREFIAAHPSWPSRTIAKHLAKHEPKLFKSVEYARSIVRKIRGAIGEKNRDGLKDKTLLREPGSQSDRLPIPKGIRRGQKPFTMAPGVYLIMGDQHCPFHEEVAIEAAIRTGVDSGCAGVYLNGDVCDFYSISRWQKDPRQRNLRGEMEKTREVLQAIGSHFPTRFFKRGNHEDRWEHYIWNKAEEFADLDELSLGSMLRLNEYGYMEIMSRQWAEFGKLNVIHGHEFARGFTSPVNPARGLWIKVESTAACNHFHKSSQHNESRPFKGTIAATWSIGCMCDLRPEYDSVNRWNHGFAIATVNGDKSFEFGNYIVDRGKAIRI